MKKNYQIPLCKKCWHINHSKDNKDCIFFIKHGYADPPYTKKTAQTGKLNSKYNKEPLIDYKKNTCRSFVPTESRKGKGRELTAQDRREMAREARRHPLHGSTPGGGHW